MIGGVSMSAALDNRINSKREEREEEEKRADEHIDDWDRRKETARKGDEIRDECQANQFHFFSIINSLNLNQPWQ